MKGKKIVALIVALLLVTNVVYALSSSISIIAGIHNSSGSSNTIQGTAALNSSFKTQLVDIDSVSGISGSNYIYINAKAHQYKLGLWLNGQDLPQYVSQTSEVSTTALFSYNTSASKTRVKWTDLTNNTSLDATFTAHN